MGERSKKQARPPVVRRVPAVSRAIRILQFLAQNPEPIGVVPLARQVKLIPSTCLHILRALVDEQLVTVNSDSKRYALGSGVLSLANAYLLQNSFAQVVRPRLEDMSRRHVTSFAAVEESGPDHFSVVAIGDVHAGFSVRVSVGARFPSLVSATGRCFAAFGPRPMTRTQLKREFAKLEWDSPPAFETWLDQIDDTRRQGYAIDAGHYSLGVTIVAVPVFGDGDALLGSITALGLREQLVGERLQTLITDMKATARDVSIKLGHTT